MKRTQKASTKKLAQLQEDQIPASKSKIKDPLD